MMKRLSFLRAFFMVLALAIFTLGCGSSEDSTRDMPPSSKQAKKSSGGSSKGSETKEAAGGGGGAAIAAAGATELESKGWGTIKGTVSFDGNPPAQAKVPITKDPDTCNKTDQKKLQTWEVGPNKGVANVVVWLRAPKGKCFKIPDELKQWKGDPVKIDQPFCAFEPRVQAVFPSYFDPQSKAQKPSGQKFEVDNSAPITHNTNVNANDTLVNSGFGNNILQSKSKQEMMFKPSKANKAGGEQFIAFTCNIHPWMKGFAWVFDHPYAVVTKEDGVYEIKNAPAGAELELVYWHETMNKPEVLKKVTLKDKETTTEDFKIK